MFISNNFKLFDAFKYKKQYYNGYNPREGNIKVSLIIMYSIIHHISKVMFM